MAEFVFCHINNGHSKVWGYDLFKGRDGSGEVITYWGRIGRPMDKLQKKSKSFERFTDAYGYVEDKIDEKYQRGYFPVPNHKYFGLINSGQPLSLLFQLLERLQKADQ